MPFGRNSYRIYVNGREQWPVTAANAFAAAAAAASEHPTARVIVAENTRDRFDRYLLDLIP